MSKNKSFEKSYSWFVEFFNKSDGTLNKPAILFTILTTFASFFFLSSLLQFILDLSNWEAMFSQFIGIYLLYSLSILVLVLVVMSLEPKYVRLNINIFLLFYLIFMIPQMTLTSFVLYILIALSLYYYPYRQKKEIAYSRKVNIPRRVQAGLYLVIFISTIAMSVNFTSYFERYTLNEIVDALFTDNNEIHVYMKDVHTKYLEDEKFQLALAQIERELDKSPEELFGTLKDMPEDVQGIFAPDMLNLLTDEMTMAQYSLIKTQVLESISSIKNVSDRDTLIERMINIGSGQLKKWIAPYELYVRFYFGYSMFAVLVILSPFLLLFLSYISALVFIILIKGGVLSVVKEKRDVEIVKLL